MCIFILNKILNKKRIIKLKIIITFSKKNVLFR